MVFNFVDEYFKRRGSDEARRMALRYDGIGFRQQCANQQPATKGPTK